MSREPETSRIAYTRNIHWQISFAHTIHTASLLWFNSGWLLTTHVRKIDENWGGFMALALPSLQPASAKLPPRTVTMAPASCVADGRWSDVWRCRKKASIRITTNLSVAVSTSSWKAMWWLKFNPLCRLQCSLRCVRPVRVITCYNML